MMDSPPTGNEGRQPGIGPAIRSRISPARFLVIVNIVIAGLGAVLGLVNARFLGPESYGVIAVIGGINIVVANFIDVRLADLAAKLYYHPDIPGEDEGRLYRASVLQVYFWGTAILSLLTFITGWAATVWSAHFFTARTLAPGWIVMHAFSVAANNFAGAFMYEQRFSGRFYLLGTVRLITQLISLPLAGLIIYLSPDLNGYYNALVTTTLLNLISNIGLSAVTWVKLRGFPLFFPGMFSAFPDYRKEIRFLAWGNALGYSKLLHRGADSLLVGFFADDRITGLYKLARSLTDYIYVLYDALNQVYFPEFMEILQKKDYSKFRTRALRLVAIGLVFTTIAITVEAIALPLLIRFALTDRFSGAEPAVLMLTLPFFFVMGIHIWLWPAFVHSGKLGRYTLLVYMACLVQYGIAILLFRSFGPAPEPGAWGYLAYYLFLIPAAWLLFRRTIPDISLYPGTGK